MIGRLLCRCGIHRWTEVWMTACCVERHCGRCPFVWKYPRRSHTD